MGNTTNTATAKNLYLVKIKQRDGEYETWTTVTLAAANQEDAERQALLQSCHHEEGAGAEFADNGIYDRHGEVHYSVRGVTQLTPEDAETLKRLGIH